MSPDIYDTTTESSKLRRAEDNTHAARRSKQSKHIMDPSASVDVNKSPCIGATRKLSLDLDRPFPRRLSIDLDRCFNYTKSIHTPQDDYCNDYMDGHINGADEPPQQEAIIADAIGRLQFPQKLYGRDNELLMLLEMCDDIATKNKYEWGIAAFHVDDSNMSVPDVPYSGSQVIWLEGYSGIGKTALVSEFIKKAKDRYLDIAYVSGKYSEKVTSSTPFSAIAEVLDKLAIHLSRDTDENEAVWERIIKSELIGPGTEGGHILRSISPAVNRLLDLSIGRSSAPEQHKGEKKRQQSRSSKSGCVSIHPSLNAIKESIHELLCCICGALYNPLVIFIDDLQWGDGASFDMLQFILSSKILNNIIFICSYRSNEVVADHSFRKVMEKVTSARRDSNTAQKIGLFSLSPDVVANFIADSFKRDMSDGMAELAEVVYTKTMGNIFYVMQALEELIRKNAIFYDIVYCEWRFRPFASKIELANYISDDVVETVKGKIRELSDAIQHLLVVMAHIPSPLDASLVRSLVNTGGKSFDGGEIQSLLNQASDEGMVIRSVGSNLYIFAHDRIRQASLEYGKERDGDQYELILHISQVLRDPPQAQEMDWYQFVAVDLLNALPLDKTIDLSDLARLNLRVSKLANGRGSSEKANELLYQSLKCLESSGTVWEEYTFTFEIYKAIILSEFNLGAYDKARSAIDQVLANATSMNDKLVAYNHQLRSTLEETSDYKQGALDGVRILNMYGFDIPQTFTKSYMLKEEAKHKLVVRNHSYSQLTNLPMNDDSEIFWLCLHTMKSALCSGQSNLQKILSWKGICFAHKNGIDRYFPVYITCYACSLVMSGKIKTSQEIGNVSLAISEKIRSIDIKEYSMNLMLMHGMVITLVQPFSDSCGPLLQAYKDLKLIGTETEGTLSSMLNYLLCYFAAGMELGLLLESNLRLVVEYARSVDRAGVLTVYQIFLQFAINLRIRSENPTEFRGEAFNEEEALNSDMTESARKQALRDSSTYRLQLGFIFKDEAAMASLLEILKDYPQTDPSIARLHNRLCFVGLAAFALRHSKVHGSKYAKLGQECFSYFENLTKHGSFNAKPVYLFMIALKRPSRQAFTKAIDACTEASFVHLEAMARERYALLLFKENAVELGNDYLTSAFWLYRDWGAHYKALCMSNEYGFLVDCKRKDTTTMTNTSVATSGGAPPTIQNGDRKSTPNSINSTFSISRLVRNHR